MVAVLAIADTDSYLKWSVTTLAAMPVDWQKTQVVISNPVAPSVSQMRAAGRGLVAVLSAAEIRQQIIVTRPDVVLLACTGPVVAELVAQRQLRSAQRPVLVTGLPGLSIPATRRAVFSRSGCDLFLLHSHREIADFTAVAADLGVGVAFGLATLPFMNVRDRPPSIPARTASDAAPSVVFAAQAKVPSDRAQREQILMALADHGSAVVKLRALPGQQQTHFEAWPYPALWDDLLERGRVRAGAVRFVDGAMSDALGSASALVTVSSTAALEAMAVGIEVMIISDFGISVDMINLVFEDSGCLGTLDDLRRSHFPRANPVWLRDNYFHAPAENTWLAQLEHLLRLRSSGSLPVQLQLKRTWRARAWQRTRLLIPARLRPSLHRLLREVAPGRRSPYHRARAPRHDPPAGSTSTGQSPAPQDAHRPLRSANPPNASVQDH